MFAGSYAFAGINAQRISDWKVSFDKSTGFLTSFIAGGDEMMSEPLMPEFARALVENDMGAKMHRTMAVWRYPEFKLKSMEAKEESNGWLVVAEYAPIADGAAIVTLNYLIHPDGTLECREIMKDAGGLDKAPDLFRFGMKFAMPGKYSVVDLNNITAIDDSTLLVLGNGFDLMHGVKSSYYSFRDSIRSCVRGLLCICRNKRAAYL